LLSELGFKLTLIANPHLCCGSAGAYSLLQPELSQRLRRQKLASLQAGKPELIATANIGCLSFIAEVSDVPVKHWLELIRVK
jgi:glycolate oxidase iron-sulfur subunit